MVERLRRQGVSDERVLAAMEALPRHFFLDKAFEDWAYKDQAFPIGGQQTISQPYTVAYQSCLLDVQPRQKVLEIGTGSGYQAAVLAMLGGRVYSVERQEGLYQKAEALLGQLRPGNVRCFHRDGYKGLAEFAPFDKIIVTAAAPEVPQVLLQQLAMGGRMVIPAGQAVQQMLRITRTGASVFETETFEEFRFVPFLEGLA